MPKLRQGDIFCTVNPMMLGRIICAIERFNDVDNQATYSHAGVILDHHGTTFEALWTNRNQDLFRDYGGPFSDLTYQATAPCSMVPGSRL